MASIKYFNVTSESLPNIDTLLHTVDAGTNMAFITTIVASNPTDNQASITINLVELAGSVAVTNQYVSNVIIPANQTVILNQVLGGYLAGGDFISAKASIASTISLKIGIKEVVL